MTRSRTIRVPDELWTAATTQAREQNTTVTALINGWLADYVAGDRDRGLADRLHALAAEIHTLADDLP